MAALSPRSTRILATVVREYIHRGEPIASQAIARRGVLGGISSATVRNILARLEESGFLRQPHTSAGRVPTDLGYRFYVDLLLETRRPARAADELLARLRRDAGAGLVPSDVLAYVSHLLSTESGHLSFALLPARSDARLHKVEFISLSSTRVMVIIVAEGGQVFQKMVEVGEALTADELRRAAEYVNREFTGLPLETVRTAVEARLAEERTLYDRLTARAYELASRTLAETPAQHTLFIEGTPQLLEDADSNTGSVTLGTLRALLELIEEKQRLVRLLNAYIDGPGLTVVIGAEHADPELHSFSLVASGFQDGEGAGSVGVIGPTRMRYSKAIAMVDSAAEAVSRVLREPS